MVVVSFAACSASLVSLLLLLPVVVLTCRLLSDDSHFLRALIAWIKWNANSLSTPGTGDGDDDDAVEVVGRKV